ncbi:MAG TPA: amino acid permease, partial [Gemmatimonadales bacterium]|nr:amino acid permease [Gemmatimonadales bacterium]
APDLVRGLNLTMSTAIIVGSMVGTGIFLKPSEVARLAGTAELAIFAWVVGGLLNLMGALCYLELGTMMPQAGADYQYLKRAWGPAAGFLYGWKGFALSHPASLAAAASGIALFAGYLLPGLDRVITQIGPITITAGQVLAAAVIIALTAVNLFRVATVGWVQTGLSALKVLSLIAVIVAGLYAAGRASAASPGTPVPVVSGSGFVAAVTASLWAFSGWHTLLRVGGEVRDPTRTMPRATFAGFGLTAFLFILVNVACFAVLGFDRVAAGKQPVADMLLVGFGAGAATLLSVAMVASAVGSLNVSVMASARVPFAVARDGLLPKAFAHVDPENHVPSFSVAAMSAVALVLVLTGSFEDLTSLFVFTQWGFYLLTVAGLIRMRVKEPEAARPVKVPGYPVLPLLFVGLATVLTISQFIERPGRSALGLLIVLAGLPIYRFVVARQARGS